MLNLTKKTDYGLMAIIYIASQPEGRVTNTKEIAEAYNIPLQLLAKVLQSLAKRGIVLSQHGPNGGYLLAKSPSEITITDIIRAIEGPIGIVNCYISSSCTQLDGCNIRKPFMKIQNSIIGVLDSITLAEINN